ncbi:MAG: DUF1549 domain-containing protein, partial [Pirellulaceae bacterium]|nr:DUF1549 domain-containing protein [Pirellulaceae bacterium]
MKLSRGTAVPASSIIAQLCSGSCQQRTIPLHLTWLVACCCLLFGATTRSAEPDFQRDVLPILRKHCLDCHGADAAEANLRLHTPLDALRGGDSGEPAIVPGRSEASYLIERILHEDASKRMPLDLPPLTDQEVTTLRSWIDHAAAWTDAQAALAERRVEHWSFQPVARPPLPLEGRQQAGGEQQVSGRQPIDAFILAKLREAGLSPSPPAERRTLIRRLYLVMHGLPPTPAEVEQFIDDQADDAWRRLVERVLDSPRYGERWATHWLDLVRFGETHGFETNRERPHAWRYRDWVIDALNSDKPYNQFVLEQLAGDAVGADLGTGFLVAGPYDLVKGQDAQLRLMQRQDELADMINATGTAFLGLTLGCARCHNHKFDPITQRDYYALQAVFAGVEHNDRALPLTDDARTRIATLDRQLGELRDALARFVPATENSPAGRRPAVNARQNVERFPPTEARFVRFTIRQTNQSQPCLDELEIYSGERNVALAAGGARATSSGDFKHPLHKLEHIHDGRYGNARSWIASQVADGWVRIELPEEAVIDRIVWGRDREGKYADRVPIDYRIEASRDGETWTLLASSADRLPFQSAEPGEPKYDFAAFPADEAARGRALLEQFQRLTAERDALAADALAYVGTFTQPGPTRRLYRGEPGS